MTAAAVNDAWQEVCLIAISKQGGSDLAFAGLTDTVSFDIGEKDLEGKPILNGGRVTVFKPMGDSGFELELYALEAGTDTGTSGKGAFDLMHTVDTAVPIRIIVDRTRTKYRALFLWTNDPTVTTAQAITTANYSALRVGFADGCFTQVNPDFTDGVLKFKAKYKCASFDKAAAGCVMVESAAGTAAGDILPVIAAYTASNKFS